MCRHGNGNSDQITVSKSNYYSLMFATFENFSKALNLAWSYSELATSKLCPPLPCLSAVQRWNLQLNGQMIHYFKDLHKNETRRVYSASQYSSKVIIEIFSWRRTRFQQTIRFLLLLTLFQIMATSSSWTNLSWLVSIINLDTFLDYRWFDMET